jgi:type I restriction enzyme S subunit
MPNSEVILQFNLIVSKNKNQILLNARQNQELASLRDWLLPMLMNGQVKIQD